MTAKYVTLRVTREELAKMRPGDEVSFPLPRGAEATRFGYEPDGSYSISYGFNEPKAEEPKIEIGFV